MIVAALFVDPKGPYFGRDDVDPWCEDRDARKYAGPHRVIAHPPCGPWGSLKHMGGSNQARRAADIDCMAPAVAAVRKWGGVLEQPARSAAFVAFGMPHPGDTPDSFGGHTIEICQVEWGHPARKRTWLYIVGDGQISDPPFPGRQPTHWVSGSRNRNRKGSGGVVPPGIKVCSAQQRRRTPRLLAEALISLARNCGGAP